MKRRVFTIVLAALLAVVGAAAVLTYVRQANNRAVSGLKAVTVLEAKATIPAGTSLGEAQRQGLLTTVTVPQAYLSASPVRTVNAANRNLLMSASVGQGQLLLQPMLTTTAHVVANGGFVIPPGMFAIAIQVCLSQDVAGFVTQGSNVAVFDTYIVGKSAKGQGGQSVQQTCDVSHQSNFMGVNTRIVLLKAQVLAVGQSSGSQGTSAGIASTVANGASAQSNPPVLVTLAVSQADAERLAQIDEVGLPYLALMSGTTKPSFDPNTPLQLFR